MQNVEMQFGRSSGLLCCLILSIIAVPGRRAASKSSALYLAHKVPAQQCPMPNGDFPSSMGVVGIPVPPGLSDKTGGSKTPATPVCASASDCIDRAEEFLGAFAGPLAEAPLHRAIDLDPGNARAYRDLAVVYMQWRHPSAFLARFSGPSEEDSLRAEDACRSALAIAPDDVQSLLFLGRIINYRVSQRFQGDESATEPLRLAIGIAPNCADLYSELGYAHKLAARYDEAILAYNTAVDLRHRQAPLEQKSLQASNQISDARAIASLCAETGRYDQSSLQSLRYAEELAPNDYSVHLLFGRAYLALGKIEQARGEQELVTQACVSMDKFAAFRCELAAEALRKDIENFR
ncbi:MAG TPA: hypothetical protein VEZ90_12735 [Blastocatellia bacterium]|nr:hypothetical protein [Blastocatellia bacterium]